MKVLWFVNTPFTGTQIGTHIAGGRGGWLSNLGALIREDVELSIAFVHPYLPLRVEENEITAYSIRPSAWNGRRLARSLFNHRFLDEFTISQLLAIVEEAKPDLIHVHGTEKGFIKLLREEARLGVPIMVSFQGIMNSYQQFFAGGYDWKFLRGFWYDRGGRAASLLPKRLLADWAFAKQQARRERAYMRLARFVDGRTHYDRGAAAVLAPGAKYFHVDHVLRHAFHERRWNSSYPSRHVVFSTMSDSLGKGFDLVAKAAGMIRDVQPDFCWRIAGLSERSMSVAAARKAMGRSFPEECFEFLGSLDPDALAQGLSTAALFVLPSYIENSPNALAEAQMLGMPCIATDVGGVATYVENNVTGRLVPAGDTLALAGAILTLIDDTRQATEMGAAAREEAIVRHDPSKVKRQILDMYVDILAK